MALVRCKECGKEISATAESCPHCGYKTAQGETAEKNQIRRVKRWIHTGVFLLGLALVIINAGTLLDRYDEWEVADGIISDIWGRTEVTFLEYLDVYDERGVFWATIIGAIMIPWGMIGAIKNRSRRVDCGRRKIRLSKWVYVLVLLAGGIIAVKSGLAVISLYGEYNNVSSTMQWGQTWIAQLLIREVCILVVGLLMMLWGIAGILLSKGNRLKRIQSPVTCSVIQCETETADVGVHCPVCGGVCGNDARFCTSCGAKLEG